MHTIIQYILLYNTCYCTVHTFVQYIPLHNITIIQCVLLHNANSYIMSYESGFTAAADSAADGGTQRSQQDVMQTRREFNA